MESEVWLPIPGFEGIYEASSLGRIRSAEGKTTSNARYQKRVWKSRVLKPKHPVSAKRQDLRVSLWKDGIVKDYLVSRLVAMAWHGVPGEGMTVDHLDGDYLNNRPDNLEWVSLSENIKRGFKNGQFDSFQTPVTLIPPNGDPISFRSMSQACFYLGRNHGYLSRRHKNGFCEARGASGITYLFEVNARLEA